jgi:hypothetical protein
MRVLRAGDRRVTPWKNGGGSTSEIAIYPAEADFNSFDWRVSIATVATDGPFSVFPEIDRTLAVLSGAGIQLSINGDAPKRVGVADAPLAFPGDAPVHGVLIDGPIVDLNVMSRRGRIKHQMERRVSDRPLSLEMAGSINLIVARSDELAVSTNGQVARLWMNDAALIPQFAGAVTITRERGRKVEFFTVLLMTEHL